MLIAVVFINRPLKYEDIRHISLLEGNLKIPYGMVIVDLSFIID